MESRKQWATGSHEQRVIKSSKFLGNSQRAVVRHLPLPATQRLKTRVRSVFSGR